MNLLSTLKKLKSRADFDAALANLETEHVRPNPAGSGRDALDTSRPPRLPCPGRKPSGEYNGDYPYRTMA